MNPMDDITVQQLKEKMDNKDKFIFLDVREPGEYQGYNLGATLLPLGHLLTSLDQLEPHKEEEIIIHCRSGARSGTAKNLLAERGYANVRNVLGGILAWQEMESK